MTRSAFGGTGIGNELGANPVNEGLLKSYGRNLVLSVFIIAYGFMMTVLVFV